MEQKEIYLKAFNNAMISLDKLMIKYQDEVKNKYESFEKNGEDITDFANHIRSRMIAMNNLNHLDAFVKNVDQIKNNPTKDESTV